MHPLADPIRDRIEDRYVAANLSGINHGLGYESPYLVTIPEGDSVVFANGRVIFLQDYLQLGIRIPIDAEFKFEVLIAALANLVGVEQKLASNGAGLIYFLKIGYDTPDIVDVIAQIASAAIM